MPLSRGCVVGLLGALLGLSAMVTTIARADEPARLSSSTGDEPALRPSQLGAWVGVDDLGSPGSAGGAVSAGVRWLAWRHLALSLDLGYGLSKATAEVEDRWWLIPALAFVIPIGGAAVDLGAGVGVGTVSGYRSLSDYLAKPFTPTWHLTVPAARAHAMFTTPLGQKLDLFTRLEVLSLLDTSSHPGATSWLGLSGGVLVHLW